MIGIFDSGSGGLSVLKPLRERMPHADILYFGDIAHAPYGNRSQEELSKLTVDAIRLLAEEGATGIASACNSVSASLSISLFDTLRIPNDRLIEMVGPTASRLRDAADRLLVVATAATIRSQIYQSAFRMVGKDIATLALPELAGAVEDGAGPERIETIIREGFAAIPSDAYDAVVLCCTHYPLVIDAFARILPGKRLIDPGEIVAERVARDWNSEKGSGQLRFLISKDSEPFRALVAHLFPNAGYTIELRTPAV